MPKSNVRPLRRSNDRFGSSSRSRLELADGTTAATRGEAIEIRDREGRLLVRYSEGAAEISAPSGDLRLAAPAGRVVIESALDVCVEAGRDIRQRAARTVDVSIGSEGTPRLEIDAHATDLRATRLGVEAEHARVTTRSATLVARALTTTASKILVTATDYERVAERVVERAHESLREIADVAEERVGRLRALVRGVYSLTTGRTVMTSTEETSIDGKRILLG